MIVTELTEQSASRVRVDIEGEAAFVLYKGELRKYGIQKGQPLPKETYDELMEQVLPKRASMRCMNLLQSRDYTTAQLRKKLEQGGYPDSVIQKAIQYVASFHYVDDLRYAVSFIGCCQETRSRRRIECDLQKKGLSSELIRKAWEQWQEQGNEQDEEEQIRCLLEKKHFDREHADAREMQRMYAFLARRGFDSEKIRKVLFTST